MRKLKLRNIKDTGKIAHHSGWKGDVEPGSWSPSLFIMLTNIALYLFIAGCTGFFSYTGFSLVAARGAYLQLWCSGFSLEVDSLVAVI